MSRSSLSDFEVLSRLGAGSFGTVYKVRRFADGELYVIKNVRIMELSRKEQAEAINEVQILAQLKSPYVVRYFDSFIERDTLHIVMEFCNRGDLQNLLKKASEKNVPCLKEVVVWNMALQVILGLYYLHKKRILHRDLKTANVFLMKSEDSLHYLVKIGDLGVAKLMDTSTALANTIVGTPYYLSPELCKDLPYRDRSDCWALGVLIFECCTLQRPFEAKNQCALIMKIIEAPVKLPSTSNVPKELSNLILWLLQKDPDRRPCVKDILCEVTVREKLTENHFTLPEDLQDCEVTNYLRTDFSTYAIDGSKSKKYSEVLDSKQDSIEFEAVSKPSVDGKQPSAKQLDIETVETQPKIGRLPSKRSNSRPDVAPSIRGDRVRGGSKRILSDKALNRYQMQPQPSPPTIITPEKSQTALRGDSKADLLKPLKSFKDVDTRKDGDRSSEDTSCDTKQVELEDHVQLDDMPIDDHVNDKVPEESNSSQGITSNATLSLQKSNGFEQSNTSRDHKSFQGTSTFSQHPGIASAYSTGDMSHMDIEGDSEFWNTVNMHNRRTVNDVKPLNPVEETEELMSPGGTSTEEMENVENYLQDLRQKAVDALGEHLFWKVYDLVANYMDSNIDGNDARNANFLEELENILCEESQADIEMACELVFTVKLILALEAKCETYHTNDDKK